jgi:hypothetical protein
METVNNNLFRIVTLNADHDNVSISSIINTSR